MVRRSLVILSASLKRQTLSGIVGFSIRLICVLAVLSIGLTIFTIAAPKKPYSPDRIYKELGISSQILVSSPKRDCLYPDLDWSNIPIMLDGNSWYRNISAGQMPCEVVINLRYNDQVQGPTGSCEFKFVDASIIDSNYIITFEINENSIQPTCIKTVRDWSVNAIKRDES